ncbi:MAG: divalent-cation tolerance protein CutA [Desulfotomaculum sp.]|nr:divalent-cation tolerance protein CutA [Desulfotomaculum sp.]
MMEEYIQVFTTTEKEEDAKKIAKTIVEERLAACVQILGPITSTYWWEESIETSKEWLLFIKSKKSMYEELEKAIKSIHPYQVPEIIAVPVTAGSKDYLEWIKKELG